MITDIEHENLKKNQNPILILMVTDILLLNNYTTKFVKWVCNVTLMIPLENKLFKTFQTVRYFIFLDIKHLDEPQKIYHTFRESKQKNNTVPDNVSTTIIITII